MFFKNEKEKCFAYLAHTACDNNNYVIDVNITSGNIHDSVGFINLYSSIKNRYSTENIIAIAMDAGYIPPHICKTVFNDNILPTLPYKRPMTKDVFLRNMNMFMMN